MYAQPVHLHHQQISLPHLYLHLSKVTLAPNQKLLRSCSSTAMVSKKMLEIMSFVEKKSIQVAALQETKLSDRCSPAPATPNHALIHTDRKRDKGGGLRGYQTNDKVGQHLWAWFSCPTKSANKIGEPWYMADIFVCYWLISWSSTTKSDERGKLWATITTTTTSTQPDDLSLLLVQFQMIVGHSVANPLNTACQAFHRIEVFTGWSAKVARNISTISRSAYYVYVFLMCHQRYS